MGEHVNSFIDNMNVLYVALTRPKQALYVFAEQKLKNDLNDILITTKKITGRQDIVKESKKKPEPPTRALNDPRDN